MSDSLRDIAQIMLHGMNKKHNIRFLQNSLVYVDPIKTLLVFIKVKNDIYPERTRQVAESLLPSFHKLINAHTEGLLRMMFHHSATPNVALKKEFFGDKSREVADQLKVLRGIMYKSELTHSITPKQADLAVEIMKDYNETINIILIASEGDPRFALYKEGVLQRQK